MKINSAKFLVSAPKLAACPEEGAPEFAFIGRSNVGKSSLINLLTGKKDLAKVSAVPGKTTLINFFDINQAWRLVDLPGYGFAKVAKSQRADFNEAAADYLEHRATLKCTFVLIDSRLPPQRIDLDFLSWLTATGVPYALVFTKIDKMKPHALQAGIDKFRQTLLETCETEPLYFQTSSEKREGRAELLRFIADALG